MRGNPVTRKITHQHLPYNCLQSAEHLIFEEDIYGNQKSRQEKIKQHAKELFEQEEQHQKKHDCEEIFGEEVFL
jgi:hypothetical protein